MARERAPNLTELHDNEIVDISLFYSDRSAR